MHRGMGFLTIVVVGRAYESVDEQGRNPNTKPELESYIPNVHISSILENLRRIVAGRDFGLGFSMGGNCREWLRAFELLCSVGFGLGFGL